LQNNSIAKVNSPVVDNVLFRERLFQTLDQARKKKAVWITGLPGSGKTTLVASYLSAKKLSHGWYHIDSSDADLATFFYYLRYVVKKITPVKSAKLPLLTPEYLSNIETYTRRYFEILYSMLPEGFILVFDNYHEINGSPLFHNVVNEALTRVPEHGNVIVISRTEPPAVFSRLKANSMLEVVDNEKIKFTPEETGALVKLRSGKDNNLEAVTRLHNSTDGWIAGIVLMLEQHKMGIEAAEKGGLKDYQSIFDYFSAEIFDKMDPSTQDFLLRTSFFPSMTMEMANKMTDNKSSDKILAHLLGSHYFTIRHQDNTYKYHDLFREFLLMRTKMYFNATEVQQIYKQAAMILKENGKIEDALGLFQNAGDWENIKQIIIANAQNLLSQGRNNVLATWIKVLPEEEQHQDPWLLYWLGEARAVFNPVEGRAYFEKAFKNLLANARDADGVYPAGKKLSNGVYLAWCGIIETFIYEYGNFAPIDRWIKAMEHIIREHHKFPSRELEARVLSLLVFALVHYNPYHPKLALWVDRTLKLLKHVKNPEQCVYYLFSISHYYAWTGNIFKRDVIEEITKISNDYTIKTKLFQKMHGAGYARMLSSKEECFNFIHEGLDMADKSGIHFLDHMIIVQAVYFFLGVDDLKRAEEYFQKMGPSVNQGNALHVIQYNTLSGWLDHLRGNTALATEKIERSLDLSIKAHIPFAQGLCRLALAQVLYEQGAYKEAEEHNKHALLIGKHMKSNLLIVASYCIEAYWFLNEKKISHVLEARNKGLRILKKAMLLGRKYGMVNVYFAWGRMMTQLCLKALENEIEVEYVQQLIQRLELFPDAPPYEHENWPWAFKFYTLGSFKIFKDGKLIEFSRKGSPKILELLQFLIVNHERAVELDQIGGALWPEAQGDYAHQALDTTIHRLRKLLGSHDAVISEAGRLMLNTKKCWVDVMVFDHLLNSISPLLTGNSESSKSTGKHEEIKDLEKRILNIYTGDFFAQDTIPSWGISFREKLLDRFTRFIERLGMYYEGTGDMRKAILTYKKGLEADNHVELFYQRLILIYKFLGRYAEAAATYKRCEAILFQTFSIAPSDKTKELYQSIINPGKLV
jgi:DNA-binding SARP family transcriptional activator